MTPSPERESLLKAAGALGPEASSSKRSDFWNPTLNIQFVEGHSVAFLYSHLLWMNFDSGKGIMLHFSTHTVRIVGRNLKGLYSELLELKLRHIVVTAEEHDLGEADAVVVHKVGIKQEDGSNRGGPDEPERRRQ